METIVKKVNDTIVEFGNIKVKLTNLDKIFFPDEKISKGMIIDYYQKIADYILPYLKNRPQSLKRNPNGILDDGFFQKNAAPDAPEWVKKIKFHSDSAKRVVDYIVCNNNATLMYMNNLVCIELNPWHSKFNSSDYPDYIIIDLDPSEKNTFKQVIETAYVVKSILDKARAIAFCKTSGGTGLHIYIPVSGKYSYEVVKDFANIICALTYEQLPELTSLKRNLVKRGNNKIYLDFQQNNKAQTIVSAYSVRPRPGANISMPVSWADLKHVTPNEFNIFTVPDILKKKDDSFINVLGKGIDLKICLKELDKK